MRRFTISIKAYSTFAQSIMNIIYMDISRPFEQDIDYSHYEKYVLFTNSDVFLASVSFMLLHVIEQIIVIFT